MKEYYIVSLKHTSRGDSAITLWRPDGNGYCWYQDWAGVYPTIESNRADSLNVYVEKEIADPLFKQTTYDGENRMVLPNNSKVWDALNLNPKLMKAKKYKSCYMSF